MKTREIVHRTCFIGLFMLAASALTAQSAITANVGAGYVADRLVQPGVTGHVEIVRNGSQTLSVPTRLDVSYVRAPEYHSMHASIQTGFRLSSAAGFFVEQYLGVGAIANSFTIDSIWYKDDYGPGFRYSDGLNWGLSPSVSVGAGLKRTGSSGRHHMVWIRPTVYWDLGLRGLEVPSYAIRAGYSVSIGR